MYTMIEDKNFVRHREYTIIKLLSMLDGQL